MKIYPFKEKYNAFFKELETSKNIIVKPLISSKGIADKDQNYIDRRFDANVNKKGFIYPEKYKEVCALIPSKLNWSWHSKEENPYRIGGNIYLGSFTTSLHGAFNTEEQKKRGTGRNKFYFTDENISSRLVNFGKYSISKMEKQYQQHWQDARFFYNNSDTLSFVSILQKQRPDEYFFDYDFDDLWLMIEKEFLTYHLDLDLAGFFDMLYLTKGCNFWEVLFVDDPANNIGDYEMEHVIKMLICLPHVFPVHDYSILFKRFNDTFYQKRYLVNPNYKKNEYYVDLFKRWENEAKNWL